MSDPRHVDRLVERMLEGDETSRREFIRHLAGAGLALSSAGVLAACGGAEGTNQSADEARQKAASVNHPKVPIRDWTFSNWPLYIDKETVPAFDKRFGGKCKYVEDINDNFEFLAKVGPQLRQGKSIDRDIVALTDYMASRWIRSGWVEAIDSDNVPNVTRNLEDTYAQTPFDAQRQFSVPWQSGAIIIGYNPKKTGRKLTSVNDLYDPKFKGKVTFLSEPYDAAGLTLLGMGKDASKATLDDMLMAIDKIEKAQKAGQIRRFTGNDYTTDLTKGNAWASMAYSGDLVQLKADNPELDYVFPEEGAMLFTDFMMIPQKAANPYAAETMMNYVYEPEVAARIAAYVNYISPVKGVKEVLASSSDRATAEAADNPLIFPPAEERAKLKPYPNLSPAEERRLRARMSEVTGS